MSFAEEKKAAIGGVAKAMAGLDSNRLGTILGTRNRLLVETQPLCSLGLSPGGWTSWPGRSQGFQMEPNALPLLWRMHQENVSGRSFSIISTNWF